jgi:hypothetical protein
VAIWRQIALTEGLGSRAVLQAWHFVRLAYRDGTARYLSHAGGAVIWEDREDPDIQAVIQDWMTLAQGLADTLAGSGSAWAWTEPSLPPLPAGHLRVMLLTASGPWLGQGPEASMGNEPVAQVLLRPATTLQQLLTSRATGSGIQAPRR